MLEIVLSVIGLILAWGLRFLVKKYSQSKGVADATEALVLGIQHVQTTYTEALKKAKEDGKLTDEEAKQAKELALAKAKELATKEGLSTLKEWGLEKVSPMIEILLNKVKGK